jgi:hypothetical protein
LGSNRLRLSLQIKQTLALWFPADPRVPDHPALFRGPP